MQNESLVDEIMEEIYRRLESKVNKELSQKKFVVIGPMPNFDLESLQNAHELIANKKDILGYQGIIITELTVAMLSHLALSSPINEEECLIMKALLQDKPVYVLEEGIEYRRYKKNAHKALYTLLMEYEDKIKKYGIKCIRHLDEISSQVQEVIKGNVNLDLRYKKLLLEADLIKKHIEGICTITVSRKCIITPLAEDYIRNHHIYIEKV